MTKRRINADHPLFLKLYRTKYVRITLPYSCTRAVTPIYIVGDYSPVAFDTGPTQSCGEIELDAHILAAAEMWDAHNEYANLSLEEFLKKMTL